MKNVYLSVIYLTSAIYCRDDSGGSYQKPTPISLVGPTQSTQPSNTSTTTNIPSVNLISQTSTIQPLTQTPLIPMTQSLASQIVMQVRTIKSFSEKKDRSVKAWAKALESELTTILNNANQNSANPTTMAQLQQQFSFMKEKISNDMTSINKYLLIIESMKKTLSEIMLQLKAINSSDPIVNSFLVRTSDLMKQVDTIQTIDYASIATLNENIKNLFQSVITNFNPQQQIPQPLIY